MPMRVAPSSQIRAGMVCAGGSGRLLMNAYLAEPAARIATVADVYGPARRPASRWPRAAPSRIAKTGNWSRIIEIDAVIVATPKHQHAQMFLDAIAAC